MPRRFVISDITLGRQTIVDTTTDQDYVIGQQIKLLIPPGYGCTQLSGKTGFVIAILSSTSVLTDIDSSIDVNDFIAASETNDPVILAIGDTNTGVQNSSGRFNLGTYVPGAFINIS
jgi:hypothetical protein